MELYNNYLKEKLIKNICDNEYNFFLNKKNVVGVALGYKCKNGFYTCRKCITVFVSKKVCSNNLCTCDMVPMCYKGIETDVIESGIITTRSLTSRIRPVVCGYSIGTIISYLDKTNGTLGCLVTDGHNNYVLSNNHVLAGGNIAPIGTKTIQPGPADGGKIATDTIAELTKFIHINYINPPSKPENLVDCAISKVLDKSLVSSKIALVGNIKGVGQAHLGQSVKKVGKVTELTTGTVTNTNATMEVLFISSGSFGIFKNQIITTHMEESGDSGAVLLDDHNNVLGLLMAGQKSNTIYNNIKDVLKELNVSIVTK